MSSLGGKFLRANVSTASVLGITTINDLDGAFDCEILMRVRSSKTGTSFYARAGIVLRTLASDNELNYRFTADEGILRVWRGSNLSPLNTYSIASLDGATWNWLRVRQDGQRIRAKAWGIEDTEPEEWPFDSEDATYAANTRHGLFFPAGGTGFHDCDFVSWGRNGENAPNPE